MASSTELIYLKSPVWLQQVAVAAWGVGWYRRRFNRAFRRLVLEFNERDYWSRNQFRNYQRLRLAAVFRSAWNSPYYREVFTKAGITRSMEPFEALGRTPLLSKETVRARPRDLLTRESPPRGTRIVATSGTTGTPLKLYYDSTSFSLEKAVNEARNLNIAGVTYRDRRVMFGARKICRFDQHRPPFWRFSPMENMAYASIYHLSKRFLPDYMAFLRSYRPVVVMGYPTALHTIANYALEQNDLPAPARCVSTHSEILSARGREEIQAAFQCPIFDTYGAAENCHFAAQCEFGRYHVSPDMGIVELLDEDGLDVPPGVLGEVVCTGLHNLLQPLIRYRIGDVSSWSVDQECPCSRNTPILEAIKGRNDDTCITADGREVSRFTYVFKGMETVKEAQVVQENPTLFVVNVVASERFSQDDAKEIVSRMRSHVGNIDIRVKQTDGIPRGSSGKFRPVQCNLTSEERSRIRQNPISGRR